MKSKLFLIPIFIIFSVFLASSVSAIIAYGDWETGSQNINIDEGESVDFNADFFSMSLPMTISIKLYDSGYNLVHSFESDKVVNTNGYSDVYTITENIYQTAGDFELILTGSDVFPGSDSHSIFLTVTEEDVPLNNPPVITSTPVTEVDENSGYNYQMVASDADGDALTYSLLVAPAWLSITSDTGLITGTAPEVVADTDFDVEVVVSDGTDSATQTYVLTIENIPGANNPPVITSVPITEVVEHVLYSYQMVATDADGDVLTYSLSVAPAWLSIDASTGLITGTAPEVSEDTDFDVSVAVSDGTDTDTQSYVLTIENIPGANNHPVITSVAITEVEENDPYEYQMIATDADGDTLTYSLLVAPAWLSIDASTGLISGTAPEVSEDTDFEVSVVVSDGTDTTTQTYDLIVEDVSKSTPKKKSPSKLRPAPYDEFYEEQYLNQFKPKTIVLDEEDAIATVKEDPNDTIKRIAIWLLVLIAVALITCILVLLLRNS